MSLVPLVSMAPKGRVLSQILTSRLAWVPLCPCSGSSMPEDGFSSQCWIPAVQRLQKQRKSLLRTGRSRGFGRILLHQEWHKQHPESSPCRKVRPPLQVVKVGTTAKSAAVCREPTQSCVPVYRSLSLHLRLKAGKTAHWVKAFATKPNDLS